MASRSFERSLTAGFRGILCSTGVADVTPRQRSGEHPASRDGARQAPRAGHSGGKDSSMLARAVPLASSAVTWKGEACSVQTTHAPK